MAIKVRLDLGLDVILIENPPNPIFHTVTIIPDELNKGLPKLVYHTCLPVNITNFIQESEQLLYKILTHEPGIILVVANPS